MAERSPGKFSTSYLPTDTLVDNLSPSSQLSSLSGGNDNCNGSAKLCQNGG